MQSHFHDSLQAAIKLREEGNLAESSSQFVSLLKQVGQSDPIYTTLMAEYIIQLRLEAKNKLDEALRLAQNTLAYDREHKINNPLSLRSLSHVLTDLGGFELAEPLLRQICTQYTGNNSLRLGEAQAHLSLNLLRTGKVSEASGLIDQAIQNIRANNTKESYIEVRESYALIVKSLIEYAQGNLTQALQDAEEALIVATRGQATFRIKQAQELLKLFTSKRE